MVEETAERAGIAVEQARAELALRESEERQKFLLKFSDALRAEWQPDAVAALAVRLLVRELRPDRCYIVVRRQEQDLWDIGSQFHVPSLPAMHASARPKGVPGIAAADYRSNTSGR